MTTPGRGLVRREKSAASQPARSGGPAGQPTSQPPDLSVGGRPVEYVPIEFDIDQSWGLVPKSTQGWATQRAGEPINDPVSKTPKQYRWCAVVSAGGAGTPAEYELVLFGKRGLVVARGITDHLVPEPGRTKWRTSRWDVPIDPSGVRYDHHASLPGQADPAPPSPTAATTGSGFGEDPEDLVTALLGDGTIAGFFGNLPAQTQRFLLQPFVRSDTDPQDVGVNPHHMVMRDHEVEEFWIHLFNRRWAAFCYARREAPLVRGRNRTSRLPSAPWAVAAWVAPALPAEQAALPA